MAGFRKKGSLTVEAVFVVPICLLVCFLLMQSLLYLHHVSWYTAAAWECALTGLQEGEGTATAQERWQSLKDQQVLPIGRLQAEVTASGQCTRIRIEGKMTALAGLDAMAFAVSVKRDGVRPSSFLRKAKVIKTLTGSEDKTG